MRLRIVLTALLLVIPVAGCTRPGAETDLVIEPTPAAPQRLNDTTGVHEFLSPAWIAGQWWDVQVELDFGYEVLEELRGKLVVSRAEANGYRVGSDDVRIGTFDRYFDYHYIGDFDPQLRAKVGNTSVLLYDWPLSAGKSWLTPMPLFDLERFGGRVYNATLTAATFEDADPSQRLRIHGETDRGDLIDYDYSAETGWMTYFRITNKTTGRVLLSVDYLAAGSGFQGIVHHVSRTTLYERVAFFPAIDEQLRPYPAYAGIPPTERTQVRPGWDWVEEFGFLFTFPIILGAGTSSYAIVRPDNRVDNQTHVGAGDQFQYKVIRTVVRSGTAGDWTVTVQASGTAGVYVALYGFDDEETQL